MCACALSNTLTAMHKLAKVKPSASLKTFIRRRIGTMRFHSARARASR
jgi:hypothetical protein